MPKNPVFEFFRQRGASKMAAPRRRTIPILPPIGVPFVQKEIIPVFTFKAFTLRNEDAIIDSIFANPHPTDVLADSSLWSPKRLDLVRRLMISNTIKVLPVVRNELADIEKQKSSPMKELLFPEGSLNPRIVVDKYSAIKDHQFVMTRYASLLNIRKQMLEGPFNRYFKKTGRQPVGDERSKIIKKALLDGISWRTIRMANKGDPRRRFTDEILAVYGILSPIFCGRDCIILTADNDIFDQVYQFSVLLHDDYGSFLIGRDYMNNPGKYTHIHKISTPFMEEGSIAIGRAKNPTSLLPILRRTCATWVIDVNTLQCLIWVSIREINEALDFQEMICDGRVADGGKGCNVHMSLNDQKCKTFPYHFAIGKDKMLKAEPGRNSFLTQFDLFRVCTDRKEK